MTLLILFPTEITNLYDVEFWLPAWTKRGHITKYFRSENSSAVSDKEFLQSCKRSNVSYIVAEELQGPVSNSEQCLC